VVLSVKVFSFLQVPTWMLLVSFFLKKKPRQTTRYIIFRIICKNKTHKNLYIHFYYFWKKGPAGALIAYAIIGFIVFWVTFSLGEMATYIPVSLTLWRESRDISLTQFYRSLVLSLYSVVALSTKVLVLLLDTITGHVGHLLLLVNWLLYLWSWASGQTEYLIGLVSFSF
jgi:hypothetical protein